MTKLHVYSIHLAFKDQLEICHHRKGLLIHDYSICVGEYRMLDVSMPILKRIK